MRYLLDTNICIYIIKRSPREVFDRFRTLRVGDVGVSAIKYCELQFGVAKSSRPEENQRVLAEFLCPLEVLGFPRCGSLVFGADQGASSARWNAHRELCPSDRGSRTTGGFSRWSPTTRRSSNGFRA
jgi:predicted nucleic acid-binding protein